MTGVPVNKDAALAATAEGSARSGRLAATDEAAGRRLLWAAAAVIALVLAATTAVILSLRESALDAAEANIARINFLLAETLEGAFQTIDLTLAEIAAAAGAGGRGSDAEQRDWLRGRVAALPLVQRLSFSDAGGRVVGTSENTVLTQTSVADRAYFTALRDRAESEPVVSEPVQSRANGQWSFIVARRISGADGAFAGAVWAAISLDALDRLFAAVAPELDARVTLLRRDLIMLARHPYIPGLYGQSMASTPTFTGLFAHGRNVGSGRFYSALEQRDRVAAGRYLERYPFVVSVAAAESTILTAWRQLAVGLATAALAVAGGFGALFWVVDRQTRRLRAGTAALAASDADLHDERARLSSVIDTASDGFWEWHLETGMVDWSERCCALMGMPAAGGVLHVEQVLEMVAPEDRERYRQTLRRHIADDRPFDVEARWRTLDGGLRWMASRGRLIRDADGRPARMLGANTDITERKLLESGLLALGGED